MKPGWKSTEFWITLTGQVIALCVILRLVNPAEQQQLQETAGVAVTAVFTLIASAGTILHYVSSRTNLKHRELDQASRNSDSPGGSGKFMALPAVLFALLLIPAPATAQVKEPTCLFGCRCQQQRSDPATLALLQQISNQQQQILTLLQQAHPVQPPPQYIVLGGPPQQQIPLGGPPHQEIPLGGAPRQELPLGGPPHQQLPLGPAPRQEIPLAPSQPRQPPQPTPPAGTSGYQRYTLTYSWQPVSRR
jgi:hypothetical protein